MARLLIAWELGGNYGHLGRQLPIAEKLRAAGHEVLFAVCDTRIAAQLLAPRSFAFVQAPLLASPLRLRRPPATYAELLLAEGYADADGLHGRVGAWLRLLDVWSPQALIVDHSPTALLAARAASLPAVHVGHGFEIPPSTTPLPIIRDWEPVDPRRVERSESRVLDTVNAVLSRVHGGVRLASLAELFTWSTQVLATFYELDPFPARADARYAGALFGDLSDADDTAPRNGGGPRHNGAGSPREIFAYVHNGVPGLRALLRALAASGAHATCVVPQLRAAACAEHCTDTLTVCAELRSPGRFLPRADLVVCSGIGLLSQALLAAVPVLALPGTVEQYLVARRMEQSGAGASLGRDRREATIGRAIDRVLNELSFRRAASAFAERYAGFESHSVVMQAIDAVEQALDAR